MAVTPMIRDFLVQLEELLERTAAPGLDRDRIDDHHRRLRSPSSGSRTPPVPDATSSSRCSDQVVIVSYGGEPLHLRGDRAFALQFVEALLTGRVDIDVHHGPLWRTTRSYLDGSPVPFLVTRMPIPTLKPRRERIRVGFGAP